MSSEWRKKRLKDLATISYGKSPKDIFADDGQIPVFGTGGIERFGKDSLYEGESIILGRKGTIDNPVYINGRFWAIDTTYFLKDFKDADVKWLYYYLRTVNLRSMNEATGVPSLAREYLYSIEIDTPPKKEQTCIAGVLSCIDRAIEQTGAVIAKQQRVKNGLMHELMMKGVDDHGNIRSDRSNEFKDSELGRIPKEWDVVSLACISKQVTSGPRGWAKYYSEEGTPFLRIGNLTREHIDLRLDNLIYVDPPQTSEGMRTSLEEDDLLISITADLGIIGVIPPNFGEAFVNQHIALVRLDKEKILPRWIGHYLSSYAGQNQFQKLNESGAKAGLNLPMINKLRVAQPKNKDEQQFISDAIDRCAESINAEKRALAKFRRLKCGLMQDLLSGEVSTERLMS